MKNNKLKTLLNKTTDSYSKNLEIITKSSLSKLKGGFNAHLRDDCGTFTCRNFTIEE
jgi:hypothetical protein